MRCTFCNKEATRTVPENPLSRPTSKETRLPVCSQHFIEFWRVGREALEEIHGAFCKELSRELSRLKR